MDFVIENNIFIGAEKPIPVKDKIGQKLYDTLNESPNHVCQIEVETGKQITFAEIKESSIRCALWMSKQGIGPDDIVVVCTHDHTNTCVPLVATFFVDAVFSAWNYQITVYTARRFLKRFDPKIIFASATTIEVLAEASKLESSSVKLVAFEKHPYLQSLDEITNSQINDDIEKFTPINKKNPDDLAAIVLTSGTTSLQKGVMISNKTLVSSTLPEITSLNTTQRFVWYSTLDTVSGLILMLQVIISKSIRIIPNSVWDVDNFCAMIENHKIDLAFIPPVIINDLAKSEVLTRKYNLKSLRIIAISGVKISKHVFEALKEKIPTANILHIYATTETFGLFGTNSKTEHIDSIGFIRANCRARFVDLTTERSLGPNQHGEIRVKTPRLMIGYYNDPEATRQAFDDEGWFRTGDIGYYRETGEAFIDCRIKDQLMYRYKTISTAEIEEVLLLHHEVKESAVVGIPHEVDFNWPVAFVEKTAQSKLTEEELIEYTSCYLEDYKRLRGGIYFLEKLPRTASGKVAKVELKQLAEKMTKSNRNVTAFPRLFRNGDEACL